MYKQKNMIRNDYITDHGLELPDICDFPGAEDSLYPLSISTDHGSNIRNSFDIMDFKGFSTKWDLMVSNIDYYIQFNADFLFVKD